LIVNAEAGLGPLLGTGHHVLNINDTNIMKLDDLIRDIYNKKIKFKNIVFDNVSLIEQWLLLHYTNRRNKEFPELIEYKETSVKLRQWITNWRNLTEMGMNVVINAWEMTLDIKTDSGMVKTITVPKMPKKLSLDMVGIIDIVGHLEIDQKSDRRWINLGPSEQYVCKTQFKGLDSGEEANFPGLFSKVLAFDYSKKEK
jgi:phage nucleotide-binding protein